MSDTSPRASRIPGFFAFGDPILATRIVALVVGVYLAGETRLLEYVFLFGAALALFEAISKRRRRRSPVWWALSAVFALPLAVDFTRLPNHHWLLGYISLSMALAHGWREKSAVDSAVTSASTQILRETMSRQARLLFVAVMGIAVVHKVVAPAFVSGSYTGLMMAQGNFLLPIWKLWAWGAENPVWFEQNYATVEAFRAATTGLETTMKLAVPAGLAGGTFEVLAQAFAALIVIAELWLVVVLVVLKKPRWFHISLAVFLISLAFMRQEWVFISTVTALGILQLRALRDHPRDDSSGGEIAETWARRIGMVYAVILVVALLFGVYGGIGRHLA